MSLVQGPAALTDTPDPDTTLSRLDPKTDKKNPYDGRYLASGGVRPTARAAIYYLL